MAEGSTRPGWILTKLDRSTEMPTTFVTHFLDDVPSLNDSHNDFSLQPSATDLYSLI